MKFLVIAGAAVLGVFGLGWLVTANAGEVAPKDPMAPGGAANTYNAQLRASLSSWVNSTQAYEIKRDAIYSIQVEAARYRESTGIHLPVEDECANYLDATHSQGSNLSKAWGFAKGLF